VQPIAAITQLAHRRGALVLVDAAQTAGSLPLDVDRLEVDLLACGGHKGLLGPLGTGLLFVREGLAEEIHPLRQGGTGIHSQADVQPAEMPARFEAGNLNVPALAGLAAGAKFLEQKGIESVFAHAAGLTLRLRTGLSAIDGITVIGPSTDRPRVGVVSFTVAGYDPQEFAAGLDTIGGLECRAGLHCAPRMHQALGTIDQGGTVRLSPGWSTSVEDIDRALELIATLASACG
jgi:cysteine desulfurase / selenocysteine lyase